MRIHFAHSLLFTTLLTGALPLHAAGTPGSQSATSTQASAKPEDTEVYTPVPPVVTPGDPSTAPPSDAIVLFDGKSSDHWVSTKDKSPAKWTVANGTLTVNKAKDSGNIETKETFKNYQLHLEWKIPETISGKGQRSTPAPADASSNVARTSGWAAARSASIPIDCDP